MSEAGVMVVCVLAGCAGKPASSGRCNKDADCDPGYVCVSGACAKVCNSDSTCGLGECCKNGSCVACASKCKVDADCDDANPCTTDTCTTAGCQHTSAAGSCDDGDACTTGDTCVDGACQGTPVVCNTPPDNTCVDSSTFRAYPSTGTCNPSTGACEYNPVDSNCPNCRLNCLQVCSGVACDQTNGGCQSNGVCVPTDPPSCSYSQAPDSTPCTQADGSSGYCLGGQCDACAQDSQCDDGDPCTDDVCTATGTCSHTQSAYGTPCDDGDPCTFTDVCQTDGSCQGTPLTCSNDPGPCGAVRSCSGTASCTVTYPGTSVACDDGNVHTCNDTCDGAGGCAGVADYLYGGVHTACDCTNAGGTVVTMSDGNTYCDLKNGGAGWTAGNYRYYSAYTCTNGPCSSSCTTPAGWTKFNASCSYQTYSCSGVPVPTCTCSTSGCQGLAGDWSYY